MARWTAGLAVLVSACTTGTAPDALPQIDSWLSAGGQAPPPKASCPYVADVDLAAIASAEAGEGDEGASARAARLNAIFAEVEIPEGFRRPPADAPVVLTAVEPPGGMYPNTVWSMVWREADGGWWFWRQNRDPRILPIPSPPPPPRPEGAAERAEYDARRARGEFDPAPVSDADRWPPVHGRLGAAQVAQLEAALANPCRAWEPDLWPAHPPLLRARNAPPPPPPQDSTPIFVNLREAGRPARPLSAPRDRDSHAAVLRAVAYSPRS